MQKITIDEFLYLAIYLPVLDVRSPSEYAYAHIPRAYSLPVFTDEERKVIGTTYKQDSRENAIKIGLDYFGVKMRTMVELAEALAKQHKEQNPSENIDGKTVLVHCWRGGMRSAAVAWLLNFYGFTVYLLEGGYKAYRSWVLQQFTEKYNFSIVGGYTGSGKTHVITQLVTMGEQVIDLEGIAKHKGSAFGGFDHEQPSQEMFDNLLATALFHHRQSGSNKPIWLEDESQRIGSVNIPLATWNTMRQSPVYFLEIPFEERLKHIISEYSVYQPAPLIEAVLRIRKRLGGLDTKNVISCLLENDYLGAFTILLRYYDKMYERSLINRENFEQLMIKVPGDRVDAEVNSGLLLQMI